MTGERQLALISEAQEINIGRSAAAEIRATIGFVDDRALQQYVERIGVALANTSHRPHLPWTFAVIDDPTPNAFALPGGHVFITRGLMNLLDAEAELAAVLGHEIAHVTARHSVTAISRQQLAQLGLGIGGIFFPATQPFTDVIGAGLGLLFLKHGRDAERQADEVGLRYAVDHRYAVEQMTDVFTALQRAGEEQQSALPSWLMTHPQPEERIASTERWIAALPPDHRGTVVREAEYLGHLDGIVYGVNPRHGFFERAVFFHPELRFRFEVPAEWHTQNLTDAVVAISPRRDAIVQLTLSPDLALEGAVQRFFAPVNTEALHSVRQPISGIPAVVSVFDAFTDSGVVRGQVAHLWYGGRPYQLLGYTAAVQFPEYQRLFQRVIETFAPVTNPSVLTVQPRRIDIIEIEQTMTLAEFSRRYGSTVPLAELALINQVDGPETTLPAGTLVKRVIS